MADFLTGTFWGNSIGAWAIALGIVLGSLVGGKILYFLCSGVVKRMASKTASNLDDLIIDMVEEPVIVGLTVAGIVLGLSTLNLPASAERWIAGIRLFVIIMCVTWLIARIVEAVFAQLIAPLTSKTDSDLDDQLVPLVRKGTKVIVWSLGTIVALNNAGYDVGALIAGLGIGGLALAMAAKDTVSNIFGGFTVFTDRPFVINDRVRVSGFDGNIQEVGIRSTRLRTLDGPVVTIPNSTFSGSAVENVTLEPNRKVAVDLGLTYDTSPEALKHAMEILKDIGSTTDGLEEKILTGFDAFGDSAMMIKFIYYIKSGEDIMGVKTNVNMQILERFNEAKLDFAFPTQTIHAHSS